MGKKKQKEEISPKIRNRIMFFLAFLAIVLYINTLHHKYAFDDSVAITDNQFTLKGVAGIPELLSKDFFAGIYGKGLELGGGRYRPLSLITFAIEHQLAPGNASLSHLVNILLYALTAVVLFLTLLEILPGALLFSFIVSVIFTAHPVHTEVVANLKSRDEILCFLGLCLTLLWLFRFQRTGTKKFMIFSCLAYFLSLMSKENGITFLLILPLSLFCFANQTVKRSAIICVPLFASAFLYLGIRAALGITGHAAPNPDIMENPFVNAGFSDKMATIMHILGKYLGLLFLPHPLSCDYSYNEVPIQGWGNPKALISFILYASMGVYAVMKIKQKDIIAFGILLYLSSIFLVSNIVFNIGAPMGERFLFLPSLGFCIVIAELTMRALKLERKSAFRFIPTLFIPLGIVLVGFSYKTVTRNPDWYDNLTLFGADVNNTPNSAKIHYYYGNNLLQRAMAEKDPQKKIPLLEDAKKHTRRSTIINPLFHHAHYNMGLIYQEANEPDSAIASYLRVLKLQPTHIMTQGALGSVYGKLKRDFDNAIKYLSKAVEYSPSDDKSWANLGIAYAEKREFNSAIAAFEKAMKLKPNDAGSYLNLGITYQNMGDAAKAKEFLEKAFAINPELRPK